VDIFLILIWMHFICDFVLQDDKTALNKSSSNIVLFRHVLIYSAPFLVFGLAFAAITAALHFVTDYFTSRVTKKLWQEGKRHWFFVVIGVDQALHMSALIITYEWLK
jgi:hypothetical protein